MSTNIISGMMVLAAVMIWVLYYQGRRYIRRGEAVSFRSGAGPWPPAAVIVPVAGVYPELEENLRSRLTQNYPQYQVVFAVRSADDPATGIIKLLLPEFPRARLVICGPATGCSQKNHNLLGGLEAVDPDVQILVFSDANQMTPASLAASAGAASDQGDAAVSGSYHHVIPQDNRLATLGRSLAVFMIYLGKGISSWDQPWGGSTAILRETFEELEVSRLWSHTVVDDVSLAKRLQQAKVPMRAAAGAVLATPARETMASWQEWFIRQLIYLKFYFYCSLADGGGGNFRFSGPRPDGTCSGRAGPVRLEFLELDRREHSFSLYPHRLSGPLAAPAPTPRPLAGLSACRPSDPGHGSLVPHENLVHLGYPLAQPGLYG